MKKITTSEKDISRLKFFKICAEKNYKNKRSFFCIFDSHLMIKISVPVIFWI